MNTMDIIFNNEDYYDELLDDLTDWCEWQSIPRAITVIGVKKDNVDGVDYYIITVNETIFGYLMLREFGMTEKYGQDGWNRHIEVSYGCETA
jgi:hypothetical protein